MSTFLAFVIFIFGPSCGGKSSLSKALVKELGPSWAYLDRDELVEKEICCDDQADEILDQKIQEMGGINLIIDTQVPWRAPKNSEEKTILVYALLDEPLKRDEIRCLKIGRCPKRAYYARQFVEETFSEVFESPKRLGFNYDAILDSSRLTLSEEINEVISLLLPFQLVLAPIQRPSP